MVGVVTFTYLDKVTGERLSRHDGGLLPVMRYYFTVEGREMAKHDPEKPIPKKKACMDCGSRYRQSGLYCATCRRRRNNQAIYDLAQLEIEAQKDVAAAMAADIERERRIIVDSRGTEFEVVFDGT